MGKTPEMVERMTRASRCHECGDTLTPEEALHYETLCEACETAIHEECALASPEEPEAVGQESLRTAPDEGGRG